MFVLGIDVGIINLGLCLLECDDKYNARKLTTWKHIDITYMRHNKVTRCKCTLGHSNCICDRIQHVIQEEADVFDIADSIIIEQQPPCGHVAVEQLIFAQFRGKAHLVSPVSMHKTYGMRGLDYNERKEYTRQCFERSPVIEDVVKTTLYSRDRSHDVYDAYMIAEFWLLKKRQEYIHRPVIGHRNRLEIKSVEHCSTVEDFFAQFAYQNQ
jgi:hypothetical protein